MSAAIATEPTKPPDGNKVAEALRRIADGATKRSDEFELRFRLGGDPAYEFATTFSIDADKVFRLTGECLIFDTVFAKESYISANAPEIGCFRPTLSPKSLPPGTTQTDVLQVLNTKLKFLLTGMDTVSIVDVAVIPGFRTPISKWRLLRGERTLYEKYGFLSESDDLDRVREAASTILWGDLLRSDDTGDLRKIAKRFPAVFKPERLLRECMQDVTIAQSDSMFKELGRATLVRRLLEELRRYGVGLEDDIIEVSIAKDAPVWMLWDAWLQLVSVTPIPHSRSHSGGCRTRTTHRRRHRNRSNKSLRRM